MLRNRPCNFYETLYGIVREVDKIQVFREQNIEFLVPGSAKYRSFRSNILRQHIEASGAESVWAYFVDTMLTRDPITALLAEAVDWFGTTC